VVCGCYENVQLRLNISGISMLERLMKNVEIYQKNLSHKYDNKYVTKLVQSFRSHPKILKTPNELFYEGELEACADEMQRERFCRWEVCGMSRTNPCNGIAQWLKHWTCSLEHLSSIPYLGGLPLYELLTFILAPTAPNKPQA